ncbi:unnamed protein product [Amoebophrya sp. A120]|nr:unnamed protein product [Amoebophrya sp. A120]|eukprot:GSA120T00018702001.1
MNTPTPPPPTSTAEGVNQAIYVALRIRPFVPREAGEDRILFCKNGKLELLNPQLKKQKQTFDGFDELMDSSVDKQDVYYFDQQKVYDTLGKKVFRTVTDGYSAALFAYGQTGSGKTTTVTGHLDVKHDHGLLPRLLQDLFAFQEQQAKLNLSEHKIQCSVLEIYNERLRDLLIPKDQEIREKIDIRSHPRLGNYIPNLTIEIVKDLNEANHCMEFARLNQTVASTQMNAKSSRAHTVFSFKMEKVVKSIGQGTSATEMLNSNSASTTTSSTLHFVDLAGRENEKTTLARGERLVELGFINKSLFHLSNCIQALGQSSKGSGNYPKIKGTIDIGKANYRNSKITMLLQEALSGNSRTFMVGTLSPAASAFDENAVTLRFAATCKNIKTLSSKIEAKESDTVVQLQTEIERLKQQLVIAREEQDLAIQRREPSVHETPQEVQEQLEAVQAALAEKTKTAQQLSEEAERLRKYRHAMMMRLGVAKVQLLHEKEKHELLPLLSNESSDPHQCGKLQYSFTHLKTWYFGDNFDAVVLTAKKNGEYEEADTAPTYFASHAISSEKLPNCAELIGFQTAPVLCKVVCTQTRDGPQLQVMKLCEDGDNAAVLLNNEELKQNQLSRPLQQGDKLLFGRSFCFRCYLQNAEPTDDALHTPRNRRTQFNTSDEVLNALQTLLPKQDFVNTFKLHHAKQFVSNMKSLSIDHEKKTRKFLYEACKLKALVEEANEMTTALRPSDGLFIELAHAAPIVYMGYPDAYVPLPIVRLARRVDQDWKKWRLRNSGLQKANNLHLSENHLAEMDFEHHHHEEHLDQEDETLFVWNVPKFLNRLELMRDIYHSWQQGHEIVVDLKNDPWVEAGPVEIEFWMSKYTREMESQKEETELKVKQLRKEKDQLLVEKNENETQKKQLEKQIQDLEVQLSAVKEVHDKQAEQQTSAFSERELQLRQEIARLKTELEQKITDIAKIEQAHHEELLDLSKKQKLMQVEADMEIRKVKDEIKTSVVRQKEFDEKRFSEEKMTMEKKFEIERKQLYEQGDELRRQLSAMKQTSDVKVSLEQEKLQTLQKELQDQRVALYEKMEKDKKILLHEHETILISEKHNFEREKTALQADLDSRLKETQEDLARLLAEERQKMERTIQLEREEFSLQLQKQRELYEQMRRDRDRIQSELEHVRKDKEALEASLLGDKDQSAAQLKRCMELSLANQKLLDQFFVAKKGNNANSNEQRPKSPRSGAPNIVQMTAPAGSKGSAGGDRL